MTDALIHTLPPPPQLAVPLDDDAILRVKNGDWVNSGDVLAEGISGADSIAPLGGRVAGLCYKPLSCGGGYTRCLRLIDTQAMPPQPFAPFQLPQQLPQLLKRAGIVGLGGSAFPAWRKWRLNLRWFIANGMESDAAAQHDAALIQREFAGESPQSLAATVAAVAQAFGASEALLALPDDSAANSAALAHPIIRRLPRDYALGHERLLIERLCNITIPPQAPTADYGAVCFNIATVLAMQQAIFQYLPMCSRLITVHPPAGKAIVLRIKPGSSVADVRHYLMANGASGTSSASETAGARLNDECIISSRTTVLDFRAITAQAAMPCIRCGACDTVCPVALSPLRLYQLAQDNRLDDMRRDKLMDCLTCRRCDEVCPSNIALAAVFDRHKKQLAARALTEQHIRQRRERFDKHQQRLAAAPKRLPRSALRRHIAAAVKNR